MLSYQHDYHAGNHADVLKHATLAVLIRALQRKPTPLRVVDTHAGSGLYDLRTPAAQRFREFDLGIARIAGPAAPPGRPPELDAYLSAVEAANPGGELELYPGSPQIARTLLREYDHVELFELHPQALQTLKARYGKDRQVHVHRRDAFEGLPAVLPPPERRGVVLIDPSYELDSDFTDVPKVLTASLHRWPQGTGAWSARWLRAE